MYTNTLNKILNQMQKGSHCRYDIDKIAMVKLKKKSENMLVRHNPEVAAIDIYLLFFKFQMRYNNIKLIDCCLLLHIWSN